MTSVDVAVLGQIARDLVLVLPGPPEEKSSTAVDRRREMLGGKGANIAVAAAQLGARVALVGVVGDDHTADWLLSQATADGIDTGSVVRRPGTSTGLIVELLTPDATWRYLEDLPDAVLITEGDVAAARSIVASSKSVIIQLQQPSATVFAAATLARGAGCRVVLDGAPKDDEFRDRLLATADVLRTDQQEGRLLTGIELDSVDSALRAGRALVKRGPGLVALATADANVFVREQDHVVIPLDDAPVRDTTGGGDSLIAALTVGLTNGLDLPDAARLAVKAAGATVGHPGGRPDLAPGR